MSDISSVFLLWHINPQDKDEDKLIGVYRTEEDANHAIERLRSKWGFSGEPEGFLVEKYELNQDHWTEGFIRD